MNLKRLIRLGARFIAFGSLSYVAFLTLSPIDMRPVVTDIRLEHMGAYAVIGLGFGLAFPRRIWISLLFVVACAACLEAGQLLEPDRHGRWLHLATKILGAFLGIGVAFLMNVLIDRLWPADATASHDASARKYR